jgi:hypothetical protein
VEENPVPLFKRSPKPESAAATGEVDGLLKALGDPDDAARRSAGERAVIAAIEASNNDGIRATAAALVTRAAGGDDAALETLARTIRGDFRAHGLRGDSGMMEDLAQDGLGTIGPRAVPHVLPLLNHEDVIARWHAVTVLGLSRDVSVLPALVALALRPGADGQPDRDMRTRCGAAAANLFAADPEGFVAAAAPLDGEGRQYLHGAVSYYHGGGFSQNVVISDTTKELLKRLYPEHYPVLSPKEQAQMDRTKAEQERRNRIREATAEAEARRKAEGPKRPQLP